MIRAPKFYFFDIGITNYLLHRHSIERGTKEYGHAFEHLVIQELTTYLSYIRSYDKLTYWRTSSGIEVDAVIGDQVAIEIKSTEEIQNKHLKGLRAFREEHPTFRNIAVSLDIITRTTEDNIEILYVRDFLKKLWAGEII